MNIRYNPPVEFLQEETRIGYTISADMKKLWAVQMDLLQYLLDICNKHGLRIYADGGTLLGAIRHHGFIPWDDDIDMVMLREDYDHLMALADEFEHPYFLQNVYTDSHYTHRHAQVRNSDTACWGVNQKGCTDKYNQGIFIDIFPADILPTTARGFSRYYNKETRAKQKFRFVSKFCNGMPEFLYKWMRNSTKCFSDKYMFSEYENAVRGLSPKGNAPVCEIAFNHSSPINFYEEYGEPLYTDFEYIKIPIPQQSHALLERQYGADYMTPQQVSAIHGSFNFDVERSYKQVKINMPAVNNTIKQSSSLEDAVKLYLKIPSTNKAKDDMDIIMGWNGFRDIAWSIDSHNSIARFISKLVSVLLVLVRVKKGNVLLIQYPFKKYYSLVCRFAHFKGGKVVTLVHDLGCFRRKKLTIAQELVRINHTDVLIVHNEAMEQFLLSKGYCRPMVTLGIFDYLSSYPGRRPEKTAEEEWKVVYAGGLSHRKNSFLYELDDKIHNWHFHIYGGGLDEDKAKGWTNITPMGLVTPDYLISNSVGHFGLVWDGSSIDECAGDWGEYLKVNNPHKTSCYLRSGKPVIMWNKSALAPFVEREGIGFTIGSLRDIDDRIKEITLDEYQKMCDKAGIMSKRLAEGYYFKKAFANAYDLLDIVRKG